MPAGPAACPELPVIQPMPTQNPSQSPDSYSRLRLAGRSLRQQLTWRLVLVFLLVAMMGSLMVLFGYRAIVN